MNGTQAKYFQDDYNVSISNSFSISEFIMVASFALYADPYVNEVFAIFDF